MVEGTGELSLRVARVAAPVREQVRDLLRQAIVDLQLRPGHRLIERELIEETGVSRTTIREVLRELAAEGLVTTIPQKGAIVALPTADEAAEIYEVRAALEGLAAWRFVTHASEADRAALRTAFAEVERVTVDGGDIRAMLQAKNAFYKALLDGAGNAVIRSMLAGLQARVSVLRSASLTRPGRPAEAVAEIRAVVDAMEAGDADAAAAACAAHVEAAAQAGLEALS